jgi:hypothetical protein
LGPKPKVVLRFFGVGQNEYSNFKKEKVKMACSIIILETGKNEKTLSELGLR